MTDQHPKSQSSWQPDVGRDFEPIFYVYLQFDLMDVRDFFARELVRNLLHFLSLSK